MIDIDAVRRDTPACESVVHFNNAGASLMPHPVSDAVKAHLDLEITTGAYEAEHSAASELKAFYTELATLLNASAAEVAYVENATRAWDMAFYGLPLEDGDRILTHESEYASNYLALLHQAKRRNLHIDLIPSDEHGQIDVTAISALVTPRTRLIAITHVPTQGGLVNPAEAVGRVAKEHGLIYLLDACQSVGQIPLDVQALQCDILSGTGRKFLRGPRGTGFLYVRREFMETIDPPFVDLFSATWTSDSEFELRADAKRFENWESYVAGRIGLAAAFRYANDLGIDNINTRVVSLADELRQKLMNIPTISIQDQGVQKCGIVTFTKEGVSAEEITPSLRAKGINTSVAEMPSARLDLGPRNIESMTRASVHYFNTSAEIERFVETIQTF